MTLAKNEMGIETIERPIDPEELFSSDECFLTGTAAHVTPIAEIDNRKIGNGGVGEIAGRLQKLYFEVIKGNNPKYIGWCTPVYKK
jgi:branched-chain amino acid aminotransferase